MLTKKFKLGKYFRGFYFIKTMLIKVLILDNVSYFTFVCFNQLINNSFFFRSIDKFFFLVTLIFLFLLLFASFNFYWMIRYFQQNASKTFFEELKITNLSCFVLTSNRNVLKLFRGATHALMFHLPYQ